MKKIGLSLCVGLLINLCWATYPLAYQCGKDYCLRFRYPHSIRTLRSMVLSKPKRFVVDVHSLRSLAIPRLVQSRYWHKMRVSQRPHYNRLVFYLPNTVHARTFKRGKRLYIRFSQQKRTSIHLHRHAHHKKPMNKRHASSWQKKHAIQAHKKVKKQTIYHAPPSHSKHLRRIHVVIDPGHGGHDPGAIGLHVLREKDVVLHIAKALKARLSRDPHYYVTLTRQDDRYLTLRQRLKRARRAKADCFIAIHCDIFMNPKAHGASVYVLSARGQSSEAARWLAHRANHRALVGGATLHQHGWGVSSMLLSMQQSITHHRSERLARNILHTLTQHGVALHRRHVEHANFVVLKSPDIPSILVETGFLSNHREAARLRQKSFQQHMAHMLAIGLQRYFKQFPPPDSLLASHLHGYTYRVKKGDYLRQIASTHQVSYQRLRQANPGLKSLLHPGDLIHIPPRI